jgi:hypothetical protein
VKTTLTGVGGANDATKMEGHLLVIRACYGPLYRCSADWVRDSAAAVQTSRGF